MQSEAINPVNRFEIDRNDHEVDTVEKLQDLFELWKNASKLNEQETRELRDIEKILKRDNDLAYLGVKTLTFDGFDFNKE